MRWEWGAVVDALKKSRDGTYQETLGDAWSAEYAEEPATGLWGAVVYKHDVVEWRSRGHASLDEARAAADDYYKQA